MNGPLSLWLREADLSIPRWSSARDETVEVLVVGAGLAGLATARALRARGRQVRVLDRGLPGGGATGRSAGFLLSAHVTDYPAMRRRLGAPLARRLLRLATENHALLEGTFGAESGLDVEHARPGNLMLSVAADPHERRVLEEAQKLLTDDGVAARFVPVPAGLAGYDAALLVERDGEMHPGKLVAALCESLDGRTGEVVRLDLAERAVVLKNGARVAFGTLVLATNAWTGALLPELGISPHRAQMLCTSPVPMALAQPCYAGFGYEYFRQRSDGRVLLGGRRALFRDHEATDDDAPSAEVQEALEAYAREHLPFARGASIEARWAGTMGFSRDGLPLLGALAPGVHTILGFSGHGLMFGLACGEVLARALSDEATEDDRALLAALAPLRASAGADAHATALHPESAS